MYQTTKQHPVSWQASSDGTRMIGHMILRKSYDCDDILGLKIVGGKRLTNGGVGAIVEKVKRGSIADLEGHIKPGNYFFLVFFSSIIWRFLNEKVKRDNNESWVGTLFSNVKLIISRLKLSNQLVMCIAQGLRLRLLWNI